MVHEVAPDVVQFAPPGWDVAVYKVIVDPPFEDGAVQESAAEVSEATLALTPVGAPGIVDGTMADDDPENPEVPVTLVAVTEKV
jgi:hypothetical protein